jgi:rhamnulokinase
MSNVTVLAVDLGAESGRVSGIQFDGRRLTQRQIARFHNHPVEIQGTLHWNILGLWNDITAGVQSAKDDRPGSIGVDAWGVDYALLDSAGALLGLPVHYRDKRTDGVPERLFESIPRNEIFHRTGIQFMPINTLYQLYSMVEAKSPQLEIAETFLTIPDLINYWFTGARVCEYTNATTTQMFDTVEGRWATDMLERLRIPTTVLPEVVAPGTKLGEYEGIPVVAPACHDTGSAVAAVPATTGDFAYISSGTWSLVGVEVDQPIKTDTAYKANLTNEGGVNGTIRLLKNVMGLWILQQCRETWLADGTDLSYGEMMQLAESAEPLRSVIVVDDSRFLGPGDHPKRIRDFCRETGQRIPKSRGEIIRVVLEGLALAYQVVIHELEAVSGRSIQNIHIIGGGSQNRLLNQMTADATGRLVLAGPREATAIGNALIQLIALGEVADLNQGRRLVAEMEEISRYDPTSRSGWDEAVETYWTLRSRSMHRT